MTNEQAVAVQARLQTALPALKEAYQKLMPDDGGTPHPDDDQAIEMLDEAINSADHVLGLAKAVTGV